MLDTKAPKKYAKLKHQDLLFVHETIKQYATKDGEFCRYLEGFDDDKVANIICNHPGYEYINGAHVERIRRLYFGNFKPKAPDPKAKSSRTGRLEARVTQLEKDIEAIMRFLTSRGFKAEQFRT